MEVVDEMKQLFPEIENETILPGTSSSFLNSEFCDSTWSFSSPNGNSSNFMSPKTHPSLDVEDLIEENLLTDIIQSFPVATSSPVDNQFANVSMDNKIGFDSHEFDILLQQPPPRSDNYFNISQPSGSRWSFEDSYMTSSLENLVPGMVAQGSAMPHFEHCKNTIQNAAERPSMNSTDELGKLVELVQNPTNVCPFDELSNAADDFVAGLSESSTVGDLSWWISLLVDQTDDNVANSLEDDLSSARGIIPASSNINEQFKFNAGSDPSVRTESSINNVFDPLQKEKCSKMPPINNLFNDFGCKKPEKWDSNLRPATSGQHWDYGTSSSGCTLEHSVSFKIGPSNTLFSNLGLAELLDGTAGSSCSFDRPDLNNQSSSTTKGRRFESSLPSSNMMKPSDLYSFDKNLKSVHRKDSLDGTVNLQTSTGTVTKFKTGSWIGDSCSMNVRNANLPEKGHEKPSKTIKKKTKPGSRPIQKCRLQTCARVAELRELIPNGEEMSIARLLQGTIKQLHFLQSVTTHAKRLAETEVLKDRKDRKEYSNNVAGGVTRACEIENETKICPLIVKDLRTPGQMLIEILCQEQGFFLEIVDIIRGLGLNILKGCMEVHETKICARYIIEAEANKFVSRQEIFSSLVELLQLTGPSEFSANDHLGNVRDGGVGLLKNSPQSSFPAPASFPDRIPCEPIVGFQLDGSK